MCEVETGAQIVHRISSRLTSTVACLDPVLFPAGGPAKGELVEITGESNCGKSCLVLELIAKIILPVDCGGHATGAVFMDCDNNVNMMRLLTVMEKQIINCSMPSNQRVDREAIKSIQEQSLQRLTIIKCCTLDEFEFSLFTLNDVFIRNPVNAFLLIDSIVAFYWNKCTEKNLIRMDTFLKSLHTRLKKLCQDRGAVAIFTKPSYFGSGRDSAFEGADLQQTGSTSEAAVLAHSSSSYVGGGEFSSKSGPTIEHRIELAEVVSHTPNDEDQKFNAFISSKDQQRIRFFVIDKYGINWLQ
ncbi:uncharacterized protein LOC129755294 [Uranotaenia lowii]|uniref:uncharacterized protein LOC129755294 n=1 Tax=Uranotaenia lowii TaxID=190385 RepID=UPI00247B2512|nr:uncharacterized protein LOC129755294 [Uranotaenia lowii]XP_055607693.1 uncharacterized protein LOC129755294 [Uranotaenia lowii]